MGPTDLWGGVSQQMLVSRLRERHCTGLAIRSQRSREAWLMGAGGLGGPMSLALWVESGKFKSNLLLEWPATAERQFLGCHWQEQKAKGKVRVLSSFPSLPPPCSFPVGRAQQRGSRAKQVLTVQFWHNKEHKRGHRKPRDSGWLISMSLQLTIQKNDLQTIMPKLSLLGHRKNGRVWISSHKL